MAQINISFDTVTKVLSVTKNGAALSNVEEVQIFKSFMDEDKAFIDITQVETDENEGTRTVTRLSADRQIINPPKTHSTSVAKALGLL